MALYPLSNDTHFDFELLRALSLSVYGASDIGEVLTAVRAIVPGDLESFAGAFTKLAGRVYARASALLPTARRSPVSVRAALFSAATYFRSADFYLHGNPADPRITDLWAQQTRAFDEGLALLQPPGRRLTVHTPDFDIPTIWFTPDADADVRPRPTIIMGNGYDGAQEETFHVAGVAALERGYNVVCYEGPGQPSVRRAQGRGFVPDWERVVTPLMDHVLRQTDRVDAAAVGLLGLSLGGYLAPRAAAFDARFAAVMALDGVWDFGAVIRASLGPDLMGLHASGDRARFDDVVRRRLLGPGAPTASRWGLGHGMWAFATASPFDYVALAANYTLRHVAHRIATPTFVGDAERDIFFAGQPRQLADALGPWAHLHRFRDDDYIGAHCGMGALRQQAHVVLDWFQGVLDAKAAGGGGGGGNATRRASRGGPTPGHTAR